MKVSCGAPRLQAAFAANIDALHDDIMARVAKTTADENTKTQAAAAAAAAAPAKAAAAAAGAAKNAAAQSTKNP